jgi:hypothetical protein
LFNYFAYFTESALMRRSASSTPAPPDPAEELDRGSWVIFELPGFTTAASSAPQDSLDALRKASDTSYYKGKDALWVKVVSSGDSGTGAPGGGTSVQVSRQAGPCYIDGVCSRRFRWPFAGHRRNARMSIGHW